MGLMEDDDGGGVAAITTTNNRKKMTGGTTTSSSSNNTKGKKRRGNSTTSSTTTISSFFPSEIVCSATTSHGTSNNNNTNNSVELALLLSLFVVALYLYGFVSVMQSVPDIPDGRVWGTNLNVARLLSSNNNNNSGNTATTLDDSKDDPKKNKDGDGDGGNDNNHITIPHGVWPVSIRSEVNDYETIVHVGDGKTRMEVPKFWSPPLHNKQQFTREQAMQVGTCARADPNHPGLYVRGDDCPLDQRTIFVAIASYRDYQCRYTVESIFLRAANPNRIRVGVVDQIVDGEDDRCDTPIEPCDTNPDQALCKYKDQVDVYTMDAPLSVGPVFARHIGHRMYRGEYYATQSDAHVTYTTDWDKDIIEQMEATHNEMAVLSTYLTDVQGSIDPKTGASLRHTRPIMCNTDYEGGPQGMHLRHLSQPESYPSIQGMSQLQPWWAAGYSFSRGHFVVNVPYDAYQPMIFQGEEMSIGIRGFTVGYDYYAPERSVCFHHYATGKNAASRNKVKHFWENGDRYAGTGKKAMARLLGIVHMNPEVDPATWDHTEEDRYGLGGVRTPEQFYGYFGIDVVKKTCQHHLCSFVQWEARMHKLWAKLLRKDGMGIDYSTVDFHWVDPNPDENEQKSPDDSEE